jgi:3-oxoacyl-[acyl-carrier protein] reductase
VQFTDADDAMLHQMLEGKLLNYIRVTREAVPYMQKAGWGRIISIAGTAGWQPSNTAMAVGLSNAAVINWTKSMSLQYAADGILVTTVAPGSIERGSPIVRPRWPFGRTELYFPPLGF